MMMVVIAYRLSVSPLRYAMFPQAALMAAGFLDTYDVCSWWLEDFIGRGKKMWLYRDTYR